MDASETYIFANGIRLFRADVSPEQAKRYQQTSPLLHEPTEETWFEHIFRLIESGCSPKNNPTFLDVGSALGYYSILFKRRFNDARLIAVDPNPHFQRRMEETFKLNRLSVDDYTQLPYAVFPHGEKVVFAKRGFGSYIAQGEAVGAGKTEDTMVVDVRRLSTILEDIDGSVDLVKMDIQGAENSVFNCNKALVDSGKVKHWAVGTHGSNIHATLLSHLSRRHKILYEDPSPKDQIDGIIIASYMQ